MTSRYHGSKLSGSQQSFFKEMEEKNVLPLCSRVQSCTGHTLSRRSVTPRDLSNTGSPAGFPKTRAKKRGGMWRIKSAMLSLCLCECGPHSPIATYMSIFSWFFFSP